MRRSRIPTAVCLLLLAASPAMGAGPAVTQLLAKGHKQDLSAAELQLLAKALADPGQSADWPGIAKAMMANRQRCKPAEVAAGLHARWASTREGLSKLDLTQLAAVVESLRALDRPDLADGAWQGWIAADDRWRALPSDQLAKLSLHQRHNESPGIMAVRKRLAAHAWATYLDKATGPLDEGRLLLVCGLAPCFSPEQRERLARTLGAMASAGAGRAMTRWTFGRARVFCWAYRRVGRRDRAAEALAMWMASTDAWKKTEARLHTLMHAAYYFEKYGGSSAEVARQREAMVSHLWGRYLGSVDGLSRLPVADLLMMTRNVDSLLSKPQRGDLSKRVRRHLAGTPAAASKLTLGQLFEARRSLYLITTRSQRADFVVAWATSNDGWKNAQVDQLNQLLEDLRLVESDRAIRRRSVMAAYILKKYTLLTTPGGPADRDAVDELFRRCRSTLATAGKKDIAIGLAMELEKNPANCDAGGCLRLARLLWQNGAVGTGQGHPGYATALGKAIARGLPAGSDYECWVLCLPLGTPEARAALARELVDAAGVVRRDVARPLAWAHNEYVSPDAFGEEIDKRLADPGLRGDRRASWLLARAYADAIRSAEYSPLGGEKWLIRAVSACSTERMKLRCLKVLAQGYGLVAREDAAKALLKRVRPQFRSPESLAALDAIAGQAVATAARTRSGRQRHQAEAAARSRQANLAELKRRLARARKNGDQPAVRRYERLLKTHR